MTTSVISSDQARAKWREVLDTAVAGQRVIIERYGKPVAVLLPYAEYEQAFAPPSSLREPEAVYQTGDWAALKAEIVADLKAELLTNPVEDWLVNLHWLRQQVAESGGLLAGLSQDDIVNRMRQTRQEIFAAEYAHLY